MLLGIFVAIFLVVAAAVALVARLRRLEAPQVPLPERPASRPGIWYLAHRADRRFPFQHLFLRLTPANPRWARDRPELFCQVDDAGRIYATLGAGPKEGRLHLEFNRNFDVHDPVSFEEPLPGDPAEEDARIEALLDAAEAYTGDLAFAAWSRVSGKGYNCNSMIHALARRARMPLPRFADTFLLAPGIGRDLPDASFRKAP